MASAYYMAPEVLHGSYSTEAEYSGDFYSEEVEEEDDVDNSSHDSEESSSESSLSRHYNSKNNNHHRVEKDKDNVLVVAGCKSCLMYFVVPQQ